jgi:hypothetical protein
MYSTMLYLICFISFPLIDAKLIMTILLNNGVAPNGAFCSNSDLQKMMDVLDAAEISGLGRTDYGRRLRGSSNSSEHEARDLQKYPAKCKQNCKGYATGTCIARECLGYRRNERALTQSSIHDNPRELQPECAAGLADLNNDINVLLPQLSSSCRPIVQSSRSVTCFDDVRYAEIESFTLWNADTDTIIKEKVKNGDSFCYRDSALTIEAIPNACVETLIFWLGGPRQGYNDAWGIEGPYTMFHFNSATDYRGENFPVGCYEVGTHIPSSKMTQPTLKFRIEKCPPNGIPTGIADNTKAVVQSFTLWNSDTMKVVKENVKNGDSFCYTNSKLTIEALPNACVTTVEFWLDGPQGGQNQAFGNEGPYTLYHFYSQTQYMGETLPVGSYTLYTHIPESAKRQTLTFRIKKC